MTEEIKKAKVQSTVKSASIEPEPTLGTEQTEPAKNLVKVYAVSHKIRHPVTQHLFVRGQVSDFIDLNDPSNIFVVHQLEAGVMKQVQG